MIYTDCHMHSDFSGDCNTSMEDMIKGSIAKGLKSICFTEHYEPGYPPNDDVSFDLDTAAYHKCFFELKDKYKNQIELLFGVEFGLSPHLPEIFNSYRKEWPFDFIIGSSHLAFGQDPYYPENLLGWSDYQIYHSYFETVLDDLKVYDGFHSYGHLDYIVRYGVSREASYHIPEHMDIYDEILKLAIQKGVGIEINTSGLKYGLGFAHPHPDILKRYRELGGEIITIGSDAHQPDHIAYGFKEAESILKSCGFKYHTLFREQKPVFLPIE